MSCDEVGEDCWVLTDAELLQVREAAHARAVQALRDGASEASPSRSSRGVVPLGMEEGQRLVLFYARKIPELCALCKAPSEVRWAAVVFYRRFFTSRSPMAFDPLPMMFACVHVACKIEEVHEITLDRLLERSAFGADAEMRTKVASLELHLLEGLRWQLLLEPKPDMALNMLWEELQSELASGRASSDGTRPRYMDVPAELREQALSRAEELVADLSVRTDAILRWPASALTAAALATVLDGLVGGRPAAETGGTALPSALVMSVLDAGIEDEPQRLAARGAVEAALGVLREREASGDGDNDAVEDVVKQAKRTARGCHKAFDRMRDLAVARSEANRKERKRRWREMSGGPKRKVATPLGLRQGGSSISLLQGLDDLSRRAEALRGPGSALASDSHEDFVIHRPQEPRLQDMFVDVDDP